MGQISFFNERTYVLMQVDDIRPLQAISRIITKIKLNSRERNKLPTQ